MRRFINVDCFGKHTVQTSPKCVTQHFLFAYFNGLHGSCTLLSCETVHLYG